MDEHRFHTPLPLLLDVSVPAGDVDVATVDGDESVVVLDGDRKLLEHVQVVHDGQRLAVAFRGRKPFGISLAFGSFAFGSEGIRVRATVPHGAAVAVATASADTVLEGRLRELEVKTASGDVRLRGEVETDATIRTVSGDARLERVGGDLTMQSVSGDLRAGWVDGSVEAKSVSGDVRVESLREGHATFTSVSGDVEIGIARGSLLDVDAGSVSGDLGSEVPLASEPSDDAGGPTVVLRGRTVSGDVRVFRAA
jgi:DUF4097 and DUF4098 domain-containing protein YvlB